MTKNPNDTQPPLVKYGLPASESHRIVDRHFKTMTERKAYEEASLVYDVKLMLRAQDALKAAGLM